jgi:hypothetical protein
MEIDQQRYKESWTFLPYSHFPESFSNKEIITQIKNFFVKEKYFSEAYLKNHDGYKIIIIKFSNEETKQKYNNNEHENLQTKLLDYDNINVNKHMSIQFRKQDDQLIKIVDIPIEYNAKTFIQHVENITGEKIKNYSEKIKSPHNNNITSDNTASSSTAPQTRPRNNLPPIYKQMNIYFQNPQVLKYIFANKIWSIQIEDFSIRILPGGTNNNTYKEHTEFFYTITGLPLNTNVLDLKPLIDHLKEKPVPLVVFSNHL